MKTLFALLVGALVLTATPTQAQPRIYSQAELDSLLAPIALHPDGLLSQILIAATYPEEVAAAAAWSRANPQLAGDDAVRAVQYEPWDPAVKALVAFPDLLAHMDASPQWLYDLGQAFLGQQAQVMDSVQGLRRRAQASGYLNDRDHAVYQQGDAILVQPRAQIVYAHYYDPYVVYGPWWWPGFYPVYWTPWIARPVFFQRGFFYSMPAWHSHHIRVVHRPVHVPHNHHTVTHFVPGKWQHVAKTTVVRPHARVDRSHERAPEIRRQPHVQPHGQPHVQRPNPQRPHQVERPHPQNERRQAERRPQARAPEAQRQPMVQHRQPAPQIREHVVRQHMPAAHGFSANRPQQGRGPAVREQAREMGKGFGRERNPGRGHRG